MEANLQDLQDTVDELMELGIALANALGYVEYSARGESLFLKHRKEAREAADRLNKRIEGEPDENLYSDTNDESVSDQRS